MNPKQHNSVSDSFTRKPLFRALEQRLMFDAAIADTAVQITATDGVTDTVTTGQDDALLDNLAALVPPADRDQSRVVVIDQGVDNFQSLLSQIPENYGIVLIPGGENGLQLLAESLQAYTNLEAIDIFSHGSDNLFQLGSDSLSAANVDLYAAELAKIGQALAPQGDLLLYGCSLTASQEGNRLLSSLSELTGADVAASSDLTGATHLGGDWILESVRGDVEADTLSPEYEGLLTGATYYTTEASGELDSYHDLSDPITFNIQVDGALPTDNARLTIYAQDIDEEEGEVDEVYLNGTLLGTLKGVNDGWSTTTFEISDLSLIRQGDNQVEIRVDASNPDSSNPKWIAKVDWGQLLIDGGSSEYGSLGQSSLTTSVISGSTATLTSEVQVSINSTGYYRLEAVLTDRATGNIVDITETVFQASAGDSLQTRLQTRYDISAPDGVCAMTFNLFYYEGYVNSTNTGIPVLQAQSDYAFETLQGTGPTVAPVSADTSAQFDSGQGYTFSANDFSFMDIDGGTLASVVVQSLPARGSLTLDGQQISIGANITVADINSGKLRFTAAAAEYGIAYSQFNFSVSDGIKQSGNYLFTLNVDQALYISLSSTQVNQSAGLDGLVASLSALNPVSGENYSYSLITGNGGADNALFSISGTSLNVRNAGAMSAGDYSVRLRIDASGTASYSQEQIVIISLVDDIAPVISGDSDPAGNSGSGDFTYNGQVNEGIDAGQPVGIIVTASDLAAVSYSLAPGSSEFFEVNATSGLVSVASGALINYESAREHRISIRATDAAGNSSSQDFLIEVTNLAPVLVDDSAVAPETSASHTTGNVFDNDSDPGSQTGTDLVVSQVNNEASAVGTTLSGSSGGLFTVNSNGSWSFNANQDFEDLNDGQTRETFVTVRSEDSAGSGATTRLSIVVQGRTDIAADLQISNTVIGLSADSGALVGTVSVNGGQPDTAYTYLLSAGDGDYDNARFTLNTTGDLRIRDASGMAAGTYFIRVRAEAAGGTVDAVEQFYRITLSDDIAPVITGDIDSTGDTTGFSGRAIAGMEAGTGVGITVAVENQESVFYSLTDDAGGRFQIDLNTGVVSVRDGSLLDATVASGHSIRVSAEDSTGNRSEQQFSIQVRNVTAAAQDDNDTTRENRLLSGNALRNDRDPDGLNAQLQVVAINGDAGGLNTAVAGSDGGLFTVSGDGNWSFDPNGDFDFLANRSLAQTSLQISVRDSLGMISTSLITMTVEGINANPTNILLSNNTYKHSYAENVVGILSAVDPDEGDSHTFSLRQDNSGKFILDGTLLKIRDGVTLEAGTYDITIRVNDNNWGDFLQAFSLVIEDDIAPVFTGTADTDITGNSDNAQGVVTENAEAGSTAGITAYAFDASTLSYSLTDDADGRFVIDATTGVIRVAEGALFSISQANYHDISVRATDSSDHSSDHNFRILVSDLPPVAVDDLISGQENPTLPLTGQVLDNDQNPGESKDLLQITAVNSISAAVGQAVGGSQGGSFTINADGSWIFDPGSDFEFLGAQENLSTSITVTVSDSTGNLSDSTLTVAVQGQNDTPRQIILSGNSISLDSDSQRVGDLSAVDPDISDLHSFRLVSLEGQDDFNAAFRITDNQLELIDTTLTDGVYLIHIEARDTQNALWTESFSITVTQTVPLVILGDIDSRGNLADGSIHGIVTDGADAGGETGITVSAENRLDNTAAIQYQLSDNAGGRFVIDANSGIVTVADGSLLDSAQQKTHSISVQATSGIYTISASFVIGVVPVEMTTADDSGEITESPEAPLTGNLFTNDPALAEVSGALQVIAVDGNTDAPGKAVAGSNGGQFTINADGSWMFDPAGAFEYLAPGTSAVTVVSVDLTNVLAGQASSELSITVLGENDAPTAIYIDNSVYDIESENSLVGTLTGDDPDTDTATLQFSLPQTGYTHNHLFEVKNNELHLAAGVDLPAAQLYSPYVVVSDGQATYGRYIQVTTRDTQIPVITGDADPRGDQPDDSSQGIIDEGYYETASEVGIQVTSDFPEAVQYSLVDTPTNNFATQRFSIDADTGVISVKAGTFLNAEFYQSQDVGVKITDAEGDSSTRIFRIAVNNLAPQANNDWAEIASDAAAPVTGNLFLNDSDPGSQWVEADLKVTTVNGSADNLAVSVAGDKGGLFTISADGSWTFNANGDFTNLQPGESILTTVNTGITDKPADNQGISQESVLTVIVEAPPALNLTDNSLDLALITDQIGTLTTAGFTLDGPYSYALTAGEGDTDNGLFSIDTDSLNVLRQPAPSAGDYSIRVQATDSEGNTADSVFSITLLDTRLPLGLRDTNSTGDSAGIEGQVNEGAVAGTDVGIQVQTDQARTGISYSLTDDAGGRFVIDSTTGVISVSALATLNAESGAATFRVTAQGTDSTAGQTGTQDFSIQITNVPLQAVNDQGYTTENPASLPQGNVFNNDTDPGSQLPGDDVAVIRVGDNGTPGRAVPGSQGGQFLINANGSWQFDPAGDFEWLARGETTSTSVVVTLIEQGFTGASEITSQLTITVEGENDAPQLSNNTPVIITAELNSAFSQALNPELVTDPDQTHTRANRTYSLTATDGEALPAWLSLNSATLSIEGIPEQTGSWTFNIVAADPDGAEVSYTTTLQVQEAKPVEIPTDPAPTDPIPADPAPTDPIPTDSAQINPVPGDRNVPAAPAGLIAVPVLPAANTNADLPAPVIEVQRGLNPTPEATPGVTPADNSPVPFDPYPLGMPAAGDTPEPATRPAERTLLPDGQFIEPFPQNGILTDYRLELGIGLEDQSTIIERGFRYQVSGAAFVFVSGQDTYTGELRYSARLADGSPLPDWLRFDHREAVFSGTPSQAVDSTVQVRVTAEANDGQRISATFRLRVYDEQTGEPAQNQTNEVPAPDQASATPDATSAAGQEPGKPSLTSQLALQAARTTTDAGQQQLLDKLAQVAFNQTTTP
ncbi:MAG: DUF4347 domain-containing protein [Pontibacterium sp.]